MKEIICSLKLKFKRNKKIIYFLCGLTIIGVIAGSVFLTFIEENDQLLVKEYVTNFSESIKNNKLNYLEAFKNTFLSNFSYSFTIFIFGISIIGIPIVIILYFIKSFMIGFSVSSFVFNYGIKGSILSIFYMIPHFINFIFYTILLIFSIKISTILISNLFGKKEINLKKPFGKYLTYYIITLIIIFITSILESFLVPFLLKSLLFLI